MNEEILKLARESGFPCIGDQPIIACGRENLEAFYHATRAALMKELLAVAGEPTPMGMTEADWGEFDTVYGYTDDQIAAAVLKAKQDVLDEVRHFKRIRDERDALLRSRVPLSDEQIGEIAVKSQEGLSPHDDTLRFARAIEAAHGIKEQP